MTGDEPNNSEGRDAAEAKLAREIRERIGELERLHGDAVSAKAALDETGRALSTLHFNVKVALFVAVGKALEILGAPALLAALDYASDMDGRSAWTKQLQLTVRAVDAKIAMGEYVEAPDLEAWLRERGIETGDGAGTSDTDSA